MHLITSEIFEFFPATKKMIGFVSIPHCGEEIPQEFLEFLTEDRRALAEDVDYKMNEMIDIPRLQSCGIAVIAAKIHRTCIDLNRSADLAVLNWIQNSQGVQLVRDTPSTAQVQSLLAKYYLPYFEALDQLLKSGEQPMPVIDLHSMPSRPTAYHMKMNPNQKMERPDFCISDLQGKSCFPEFISFLREAFQSRGFVAWANDPYQGGYVTKYIAKFGANNVQIETKRSIYMDERARSLTSSKVQEVRKAITEVIVETLNRFAPV